MGLFNRHKEPEKKNVSAVIDASLIKMLEDLQDAYELDSLSSTINEVLDTFRDILYDEKTGRIKPEFEIDDKKEEDNK